MNHSLFNPAFRYSSEEIEKQTQDLLRSNYFSVLLEEIPNIILVINNARQLVYANMTFINELGFKDGDDVWGHRPGESMNCVRAVECSLGCGSTPYCKVCGFANAIAISEQGVNASGECNIINIEGKTLSYNVATKPFVFEGTSYIFCYLQELSDQKAHQFLERTFLHDIQNSIGVLYAMNDLMDELDKDEIRNTLKNLTLKLDEEISSYRLIKDAENNNLSLRKEPVEVSTQIKGVITDLQTIKAFRKRKVEFTPRKLMLWTDKTLLRRVLMNLVKNAMEASSDTQPIQVWLERDEQRACLIHVKSQSLIPEDVKLQLFQKSFSTKGRGRGWGTYSIRLLTEKFLEGSASFVSDEVQRTIFTVRIPDMSPSEG